MFPAMGAGKLPTNDAEIIARIIDVEKGFVDNPADRGGPTKYGISLGFLADLLPGASKADVQALTIDDAVEIYQAEFIIKPGFSSILDPVLRWTVVDAAVNHGPKPATKLLQRALGVKDDGVLGDITRHAIYQADQRKLSIRVCTMRARLYSLITSKNLEDKDRDGIPDNLEMLNGWTDRAMTLIETILA